MELQHSFTVPAGVEKAWATLLDLEGVAPCFPGATLTGSDGQEFTGEVKVKLGPISLQYAGKGRFVARDDADHRAVIEAHGSDKCGNGAAGATVVARLESEGEDATRVVVSTQLKVTGRPAQLGRGVMQDVGSGIVDQFAVALARQMSVNGQAEAAEPAPTPAPTPAPAPASTNAAAPAPTNAAAQVAASVSTNAAAPAPTNAAASISTNAAAPVAASVSTKPEPTREQPPKLADATAPLAPPRPAAPRPTSVPRASARAAESELDLNAVVLPLLARRYGPTVIATLVIAIVSWWIARRRR